MTKIYKVQMNSKGAPDFSTAVEIQQGEWEIVGKNHPYKRCPFCKRVRAFTDTRFCDWCGARMKGADDE